MEELWKTYKTGTFPYNCENSLSAYKSPAETLTRAELKVKEHERCPPNQTKEEEIGNLPQKEFRIMIIKMTQNLENKMELQINSLETKIEKMQEMFNKDLEETKESQLKMNNAIKKRDQNHSGGSHE